MEFRKKLDDDKRSKNVKPLTLPHLTSTRPLIRTSYFEEIEKPHFTNQITKLSNKHNIKIPSTSENTQETRSQKKTLNASLKKPADSMSNRTSKREAFRKLMEETKANMSKQERPKKLSVLDLPERKFRVDGMISEFEDYRREFWNNFDAMKEERDELEIKMEFENDEEKKKKMERDVLLIQQELDRKYEIYQKEKNKYWSYAKKEVKYFNKKLSEIFGGDKPKWQ